MQLQLVLQLSNLSAVAKVWTTAIMKPSPARVVDVCDCLSLYRDSAGTGFERDRLLRNECHCQQTPSALTVEKYTAEI
jgi:hypothetical protein